MNGAQLTLGFGSHRSELKAYCSRLLGSPVEAEDAVQETLLRAWRAADRFEGRATVRSWLYRIAKNVCIDAANRRSREPMPIEEWDRSDQGGEPDPAEIALAREDLRLALTAAVHHLPPRQRAVLLLRDILCWRAAEVAELLGTSEAAVNSALQRAHATLAAHDPARMRETGDQTRRGLVARYLRAFEQDDVDALMALTRDEPALAA